MLPDYYAILGVSPDASIETIRRAYAEKAKTSHPDRGGSHEQMLLINEAWEWLSNPQLRAEYDAVRAGRQAASAGFENQRQGARERAQQYPTKWSEFEKLLKAVVNDVSSAQYGSEKWGHFSIPTVEKSKTGMAFVVIGCVVGAAAWFWMTEPGGFLDNTKSSTPHSKAIHWRLILRGLAGAWLGAGLHAYLAQRFKKGRIPASATGEQSDLEVRIVDCTKCGQKLRIPKIKQEMSVNCPSCKNNFDVSVDERAATTTDPKETARTILFIIGFLVALSLMVRGCK